MTLVGFVAAGLIGVVYFWGLIGPTDNPRQRSDPSLQAARPSQTDDKGRLTSKKIAKSNSRPAVASVDKSNQKPGQRVAVELTATDADGDTGIDRLTNALGMELALIPAGEFTMGSPPDEQGHFDDETQHVVRISSPFYMAVHEVTVGQFRTFVEGDDYRSEAEVDGQGGWGWDEATSEIAQKPEFNWRNPGFVQDDTHPVVNVSWNDAVAFCNWLSAKEGKQACYRTRGSDVLVTNGNGYRLPTEAEREYACRGGTRSAYHHGDDPEGLVKVANSADDTAKAKFADWHTIEAKDGFIFTAPVGSFKANSFGLHDMHGNVWEWCQDWYGQYGGDADDPMGPATGVSRVIRGGGWFIIPPDYRSADRVLGTPSSRDFSGGFRVVVR